MAKTMHRLMGVSGSESLAAAANVFMGQTEAPIIVAPYISAMTRSELMALMTTGMATVSGAVLGIYRPRYTPRVLAVGERYGRAGSVGNGETSDSRD